MTLKTLYKLAIVLALTFFLSPLFAKEGMWIPATLKAREADMKLEGLQMPIEKIYNDGGTGLNNALVLFGRGCTGELISSKGLVLTNHHCGYGSAQRLSSPDKDYFSYGFWANSTDEELPCAGLTVTFIRKMEQVTERVTSGIADTLPDAIRDSLVMQRVNKIEAEYKKSTGMDATIKPFYQSNQYWVIISETYTDIRLVGFPPNGIGKFGGDVENWMWPRHTGDFSIFRVYAGEGNKPAQYAKTNKPFSTDKFFSINTNGYKEGDFTMVYGFPGTTDEYAFSGKLREVCNIIDPINIYARTVKLNVWNKHMDADRGIFIKYTAKNAGIANGWKKWQGELMGLKANHVLDKKSDYEKSFQKWANKDNTLPFAKTLLAQLNKTADEADTLIYQDQYNKETVMGIELVQQAAVLDKMLQLMRLKLSDSALKDTLGKVAAQAEGFYKNYDLETDKDEFKELMGLYFKQPRHLLPKAMLDMANAYNMDYAKWAVEVYSKSVLSTFNQLKTFAATTSDSTKIKSDPAWKVYHEISIWSAASIAPRLSVIAGRYRYLNRLYMKAQMVKDKTKAFYPDANLTLRLTYGKVAGLDPEGPDGYSYQTTLGEVVALDDSTKEDFRVPKKLKELYLKKDYGRWGVNGVMPVAFVASNHTSGGNSGSPVLNAKGELIGTNFDRAYEGTMSDYYFDPKRCRNISVDIRYTLFIIEKFGNAGWLLDEMNLVKD